MPQRIRRRTLLAGLVAAPALAAEPWPSRPVRLIVGYPAGASTDLCARVVAEDMRGRLGQPVLVENRPGANGSLGAAAVAASPPDGHTLLLSNTSTMTVNHLLYRDIRYHPLRDLLPVATITIAPFILAISPANPRMRGIRSLADLLALARSKPGGVSYGSGGNGNLQHLYMELFASLAGLRLLHVPYRGAALAENALVAGDVDMMLETPTATPLIRAGTLAALASSGAERWRDLPEVPTFAEAGQPGFVVTFWNGLVAPAGLPPEILGRLATLMQQAADAPATRQALLSQGDVMVLGPEAFRDRIAADIERNAATIRGAGVEMQ